VFVEADIDALGGWREIDDGTTPIFVVLTDAAREYFHFRSHALTPSPEQASALPSLPKANQCR